MEPIVERDFKKELDDLVFQLGEVNKEILQQYRCPVDDKEV